jgi:hypothetical protein
MKNPMNDLEVLSEQVGAEQRRLEALTAGGAWLACFRQRRRLNRARKVAAWSKARAMGKDTFIRSHGVLQNGGWVAISTAAGWFVGFGVDGLADGVGVVLISLLMGLFFGVLSGIIEWERSAADLSSALARLSAHTDGPGSQLPLLGTVTDGSTPAITTASAPSSSGRCGREASTASPQPGG